MYLFIQRGGIGIVLSVKRRQHDDDTRQTKAMQHDARGGPSWTFVEMTGTPARTHVVRLVPVRELRGMRVVPDYM
jgi:hypothetical protein